MIRTSVYFLLISCQNSEERGDVWLSLWSPFYFLSGWTFWYANFWWNETGNIWKSFCFTFESHTGLVHGESLYICNSRTNSFRQMGLPTINKREVVVIEYCPKKQNLGNQHKPLGYRFGPYFYICKLFLGRASHFSWLAPFEETALRRAHSDIAAFKDGLLFIAFAAVAFANCKAIIKCGLPDFCGPRKTTAGL